MSTPTRAQWVSMMTFYELRRYHPKKALRDKLGGRVTLVCRVTLSKRVYECRVTEEAPVGHGFGAAARRASRQFRVFPRRLDGVEVAGAPVLIPIRFDPEPLSAADASN